MTPETMNLMPMAAEIFVLTMACLVLVVDPFVSDRLKAFGYHSVQLTLIGAALVTLWQFPSQAVITMHGTFVGDPVSAVLKICIYIVSFLAFLYSREYLIARSLFRGEYFVIGLFAVLGMMILVSAHSFLTIYLGLELLSLSLYTLVAMQRDSTVASEAAMKYFVLGAIASGMLLYGISMIYGVTGTLDIGGVSAAISGFDGNRMLLVFGLVFLVVGIGFKLGAVPFHMWIPDVYQGAPTAVTLFIGTAPKIAAFAMAWRILGEGLGGLLGDWQQMLIILAVLSMAAGNLIAIAQSNIKRMLAYSTIAHIGYLLLGLIAGSQQGYAASMFYVIVYALMGAGAFGMIILLGRAGFESDRLEDMKGLNERSPWFAFIMLVLMFAMAGVPPFLGFWAKWMVLKAVIASGLTWLAALAVLFSIIGAFYYVRIVKLMYFDKPGDDSAPIQAGMDMRAALSLNGLAILLIGLFPGALMGVCLAALGV